MRPRASRRRASEPRRRDRELEQLALSRVGIHVHEALRVFERQTPQKEIVDQTEDGGVESDAKRQGDDRDKGKRRRFAQFTKSEASVVHRAGYSVRNA